MHHCARLKHGRDSKHRTVKNQTCMRLWPFCAIQCTWFFVDLSAFPPSGCATQKPDGVASVPMAPVLASTATGTLQCTVMNPFVYVRRTIIGFVSVLESMI